MPTPKPPSLTKHFDLSGRVAVVTGGSRGLGREIAMAYAECGADVVIASRKLESCETTAAEISERTGRTAVAAQFHAARWADAETLTSLVYTTFGRCDILVNNAGIAPLYPSLPEVSEELFDKVVGVNYKGPFRLSSLIGARMVDAGGGSIINVSSTAAIEPRWDTLVYGSAKAALNALTVGLSRAFAPTVRCNGIMPGPFLTDIAEAWSEEVTNERLLRKLALRRIGEPAEIVGAAVYLGSDASSFTTGSIIKVDGGMAYAPA